MSTSKSFGEIVGLSYEKSSHSLYEFNRVITNLIDYEYNLVKFILQCVFTRYCDLEKLYYFNRRDLVLFITGLNCDDLVEYNKIGFVSEDPFKIKQIHLPFNNNYNYITTRLRYMIEKNIKLSILERYHYENAVCDSIREAIASDTEYLVFKIYRNTYTIKMPDKDYLYKPSDITLLLPIIQKWYKQQFPDNNNNLVINIISKKILDCFN